MILARPLPKLHNVLGSTVSEDGEWVLNGAFMSFERSRWVFVLLLWCTVKLLLIPWRWKCHFYSNCSLIYSYVKTCLFRILLACTILFRMGGVKKVPDLLHPFTDMAALLAFFFCKWWKNKGNVSCSSFLKACIEEFVATYDETSLGWNGADLLNRVASNATRKGGKVWLEQSEHLQVLEPIAFFPLSRHSIIKYSSVPPILHKTHIVVYPSGLSLLLLVWVSSKILSVLFNRYLVLSRCLKKLVIIRLVTTWNSFDNKIWFVLV